MHARLDLDPARRAVDTRHSGRQLAAPAGPDQGVGPALVARRDPADIRERVGPHIDDFNHVIAPPRVRRVENERLLAEIDEAEAIDHVDVRGNVAGLLRDFRRGDILDPPEFARRSLGVGPERNRAPQIVHRDDRGRVDRGLQGERMDQCPHRLGLFRRGALRHRRRRLVGMGDRNRQGQRDQGPHTYPKSPSDRVADGFLGSIGMNDPSREEPLPPTIRQSQDRSPIRPIAAFQAGLSR